MSTGASPPEKSPTDPVSFTSADPPGTSSQLLVMSPKEPIGKSVRSRPTGTINDNLHHKGNVSSTGQVTPEVKPSLNSSASVLPVDLKSGKPAEMTKPPPENITGSAQKSTWEAMLRPTDTSCLNFDDEDPEMAKRSLFDRAQAAWNIEGFPHGRFAADLERESEVKPPPLDNKTHLNAGKHVFSSKENFSKKPWTCEKEPLFSWLYEFETDPFLIPLNIERVSHQYSAHREIRGDGNGFYRVFMFAYMEHILDSKDIAELARLKERIKECKITMEKMNYRFDSSTFDDTVEKMNNLISDTDVSISSADLMGRASDSKLTDSMGKFLRYVTASEIRKCKFLFDVNPADNGEKACIEYCETYVLPLGAEGDEFRIMALCGALGVPIRVVYLNRCGDETEASSEICTGLPLQTTRHANPPEETLGRDQIQPRFTLAFRPEQFDILYPKENDIPLE